jgi:hypothetical protein
MTLHTDPQDSYLLNDQLGRLIRRSLQARVFQIIPANGGRELLLAAARLHAASSDPRRESPRQAVNWASYQSRGWAFQPEYDLWSALIHARHSFRLMAR